MDDRTLAIQVLSSLIKGASIKNKSVRECLKAIDIFICNLSVKETPSESTLRLVVELLVEISSLIHSGKENIHQEDKIRLVLSKPNLIKDLCQKRINYYQQ